MFKWIHKAIKENPVISLFIPTGLGGLNFVGNLISSLSDGSIDGNELHQLLSSASGIETVFLMIIMVALKNNHKK